MGKRRVGGEEEHRTWFAGLLLEIYDHLVSLFVSVSLCRDGKVANYAP